MSVLNNGVKNGHGGVRVGAGRPQDKVKKLFEGILKRSGAYERMEKLLKDPLTDKETFIRAFNACANRAHGMPVQQTEVSGPNGSKLIFEFPEPK